MLDNPARETRGPAYRPEIFRKLQSPAINGNGSPERKDWTPDVRRPDTQETRPQDPAPRTRTKDFAEARTSWDSGLHGIQDYAGTGTSWDSRLRKTLDFVGSRTPQKTGTLNNWTRILFCGVLRENTTEQDPGPGVQSSFFLWSPRSHEVLVLAKS